MIVTQPPGTCLLTHAPLQGRRPVKMDRTHAEVHYEDESCRKKNNCKSLLRKAIFFRWLWQCWIGDWFALQRCHTPMTWPGSLPIIPHCTCQFLQTHQLLVSNTPSRSLNTGRLRGAMRPGHRPSLPPHTSKNLLVNITTDYCQVSS